MNFRFILPYISFRYKSILSKFNGRVNCTACVPVTSGRFDARRMPSRWEGCWVLGIGCWLNLLNKFTVFSTFNFQLSTFNFQLP